MTTTPTPVPCDEVPCDQRKLTPSQVKKRRKYLLSRRDGKRCFYCHRPFARLSHATIDHVVPRCLFRTNALVHVVLACELCNRTKADRLPLSMALLLCAYADRSRPTANTPDPAGADQRDDPRRTRRHTRVGPIGYAGWVMLARLASANESAERSTPDLYESTPGQPAAQDARSGAVTRLRAPTGLPDSSHVLAPAQTHPTAGEVAA